jgi:hypothetical protein
MRRKNRLRAWLDEYKKCLKCERCGFSDFRALQFHHRERDQKEFNIADMAKQGWSVEGLRREMAKCMILCANCHMILHYVERNGAEE